MFWLRSFYFIHSCDSSPIMFVSSRKIHLSSLGGGRRRGLTTIWKLLIGNEFIRLESNHSPIELICFGSRYIVRKIENTHISVNSSAKKAIAIFTTRRRERLLSQQDYFFAHIQTTQQIILTAIRKVKLRLCLFYIVRTIQKIKNSKEFSCAQHWVPTLLQIFGDICCLVSNLTFRTSLANLCFLFWAYLFVFLQFVVGT